MRKNKKKKIIMGLSLHDAYPIVDPHRQEDACCRSHRIMTTVKDGIYGQQLSYIPPLGWIPLTPIVPSDFLPKNETTPCPQPCSVVFSMFR